MTSLQSFRYASFILAGFLLPAVAQSETEDAFQFLAEEAKVVAASLREQKPADAPASVTVVTAEQIKQKGYRTIKDIMLDVPGFTDVSDGNEEIVAMRGTFASTTNKILTLVNGHRMNDLMLGRYNTDQFLGLDTVDRVEFIRGPGSALYGTGALLGVVNIVTKRGGQVDGTYAKVRSGFYEQEGSLTWGKKFGDGKDALVNVTYLDAKGEEVDQPASLDRVPAGQAKAPGVVYAGKYPRNFSAFASIHSDGTSLDIRGEHYAHAAPRTFSSSFYVYDQEPFPPLFTEDNFYVNATREVYWGSAKLTINPSIHYYNYQELSVIPTYGANLLPPDGSRTGQQTAMQNSELKVTYENQLLPSLNVLAGYDGTLANFNRSDGVLLTASTYTVTPDGNTKKGTWYLGGYLAQAVWSPLDPLSITVGGRYDTYEGEADSQFTPRAGVVYHPTEPSTIKVLYGTSYLAPMWAHKNSGNPSFVGNPNLQPERFTGVDLIYAYDAKRWRASADAFYTRVKDLITAVGANYVNQGASMYEGFELDGQYSLFRPVRLNAAYSYIDPVRSQTSASFLTEGKITNIPTHTLHYGVDVKPIESVTMSLTGRTYTATKVVDTVTGNNTLPPLTVLDASVRYVIRGWDLQLLVKNLTNNSYELGSTSTSATRPLARQGIDVEGIVGYKF